MPKERKQKASYSCAPCKRLKIKCDHNIPCSNCVKNNRQDECLSAPAKSLSQFKELIRPNPLFGRIAKSNNPAAASKRDKSSISSTSSVESGVSNVNISPTSPLLPALSTAISSSSKAPKNSTRILESRLEQKSAALEQALQQNSLLTQQNNELKRRSDFYFHLFKTRQSVQDLYTVPKNQHENFEKYENFKRSMLELIPSHEIVMLLKTHFLLNLNRQSIIHAPTFEAQLQRFWYCLSINGNITEIDLHWLGLLFIILAVSLISSLNNTSPLLQHHQQQVPNSTTFERSFTWFNTARQILTFIGNENHPNLITLQTLILATRYCVVFKNFKLFDVLLAESVNQVYSLKLHEPDQYQGSLVEVELKKRALWSVIGSDTLRSFELRKTPMLCETKFPVPLNLYDHNLGAGHLDEIDLEIPTDTSFDILKVKFLKLLNKFKLRTIIVEDPYLQFQELLNFDHVYADEYLKLPWFAKLDKNDQIPRGLSIHLLFELSELHLFHSVTRFKVLQKFLTNSLPYIDQISLNLVKNMFVPHKKLKLILNPVSEALLMCQHCTTLDQSFIGGCIVQLLFLILVQKVSEDDRNLIMRDVDMVVADLVSVEEQMLNESSIVLEAIRVIDQLRSFVRNSSGNSLSRSEVTESSLSEKLVTDKMNVNALVNDSGTENAAFSTVQEPVNVSSITSQFDTVDSTLRKCEQILAQNPGFFETFEEGFISDLQRKIKGLTSGDIDDFKIRGY